MKTKQYDLLNHSSNLIELLAEMTENTEIVITRGDTPIARLLPINVDVVIHTPLGETIAIQVKAGANGLSSNPHSRKPNLHPGAFMMSDDFDEPLPDSFWLGEE